MLHLEGILMQLLKATLLSKLVRVASQDTLFETVDAGTTHVPSHMIDVALYREVGP